MRTRLLVMAVGWLLAACAQQTVAPTPDEVVGLAPTVEDAEPTPLVVPTPGLSPTVVPSPQPGSPSAAPVADASASPGLVVSPTPTTSPGQPSPTPSPTTRETESDTPAPVVLLAVADRTGDHGVQGPAWVDLTAVELVEIGNDLRVTLRFAGDVPAAPPSDEVPLLGVDIGDEGYQLFVDGGGPTGEWAAYLDTPDGFVSFPGTFRIAGRAIVLELGFNHLGSPTRAPVRVFVEWSADSLVLNPTSEDRLDGEPHTFDRAP